MPGMGQELGVPPAVGALLASRCYADLEAPVTGRQHCGGVGMGDNGGGPPAEEVATGCGLWRSSDVEADQTRIFWLIITGGLGLGESILKKGIVFCTSAHLVRECACTKTTNRTANAPKPPVLVFREYTCGRIGRLAKTISSDKKSCGGGRRHPSLAMGPCSPSPAV